MSMSIVETFHGYIETTQDTLLIFEACRRGLLPRICRRLQEKERKIVRSGTVFVFDERESGIKRWTDGLVWSPSRILGNFLIYRELDKRAPPGEKKAQPSEQRQRSNSADESSVERNKERALVGSLTNSYKFKKNGLIKKTMSIVVHGVNQHLISYYTKEDVLAGKLQTPSSMPNLAGLEISPEFLMKQNFRIPPVIEASFGEHGEPESPTSVSSPTSPGLSPTDRRASQSRMSIGGSSPTDYMGAGALIRKGSENEQSMDLFNQQQRSFGESKPGAIQYNPQPGIFNALQNANFGYGQSSPSSDLASPTAANTPLPSPTPMRGFSQPSRGNPQSAFSSFSPTTNHSAPAPRISASFGHSSNYGANILAQPHMAPSEFNLSMYNGGSGGGAGSSYPSNGQWHDYQSQYGSSPGPVHPLQHSATQQQQQQNSNNLSSFGSASANGNHQPSNPQSSNDANNGMMIYNASAGNSSDSQAVSGMNALYHSNNAYNDSASYNGVSNLHGSHSATGDDSAHSQQPTSPTYGLYHQSSAATSSPPHPQHGTSSSSSGSGSGGFYNGMFSSHSNPHIPIKSEGYSASMPSNSFMPDLAFLTQRFEDSYLHM